MRNEAFWTWFDTEAAPKLALREISFRKIFSYLDAIDGPLTIVETGCSRQAGNWAGDGQSTVLFDRYLSHAPTGSFAHTVDLDPKATELCKTLVGDRVRVHTGDSVVVLLRIADSLKSAGRTVDLLYLDSYDVDWTYPTPSAVHHLKELVSIVGVLRPDTLVVIDDAPATCRIVGGDNGQFSMISPPTVGGKGGYVAEYANQVQAKPMFSHYQVGWTELVKDPAQ